MAKMNPGYQTYIYQSGENTYIYQSGENTSAQESLVFLLCKFDCLNLVANIFSTFCENVRKFGLICIGPTFRNLNSLNVFMCTFTYTFPFLTVENIQFNIPIQT